MWKITEDFIDAGRSAGVSSADFTEDSSTDLAVRFRLLDDDGEIYYEGVCDDADSEGVFEPLDNFGAGFAGCTSIQVFRNGRWEAV